METPTSDISVHDLYIIKELLPKNGELLNVADQAPAPSKDFAQIQMTVNEVTRMKNSAHYAWGTPEPDQSMGVMLIPVVQSFIGDDGTISVLSCHAPPPDKDYTQLTITTEEVIFRFWRITLRKNGSSLPVEMRQSLQDFLYDERLQSEIHRLFGSNMLVYVRGLASGHIDYLARLPPSILLEIIMKLELEDISKLAQTNKMFNKLCNGNDVWERIYRNHTKQKVSPELHSLAMAIGWQKLFFTNKIQLQVRMRRQAAMKKKKRQEAEAVAMSPIQMLVPGQTSNTSSPRLLHTPQPPRTPPPPQTSVRPQTSLRSKTSQDNRTSRNTKPIVSWEDEQELRPPPPDISPYPEGKTKPKFQDGPEDYSNYELFDPRDARIQIDIESDSDDDGIDEEAEAERRRIQKQKEYDAVTFDDWGEDFSFLED